MAESIAFIKEGYNSINKKHKNVYEIMICTDEITYSLWQLATYYDFPIDKKIGTKFVVTIIKIQ